GNVKISREEVHSVTQQYGGDGDPSIGELRAKIRQQPLHQY
ncbi:farnesyl-diphosphate farnesyltransferase, partial [Haloferax sp. Atlit-10N]